VHNVLAVQRVIGGYAVHGFLHAQAVGIVHKLRNRRVARHAPQLAAVLPGIRPHAVMDGIADRIVGDIHAVEARQLILPVRIAVFIGYDLPIPPKRYLCRSVLQIKICVLYIFLYFTFPHVMLIQASPSKIMVCFCAFPFCSMLYV